ncbi:hypothetical protein QBC34DRAFT_311388 [Podospora aff. communis PSN243]|uniref:SnoaL-like domain-containing protein n=1 Tax=Podospora aff. communis PSN243 TaxID=3040156 RepID=A0AAV9G6Y1_9PEZI|nr:hypothetical protein QBC34DRAFT_311388 [Podospora aff. communis PSN243]
MTVEETPAPIPAETAPVLEEVVPVLEATPVEVVAPVEEKPTETAIYSAPSTVTSAVDPHTKMYSHINGSAAQLLDRLAVAELCKGWPVYRDASEWGNYRDLFTEDGTVWTTWSGPRHISDFISISQAGKKAGVFIMHRECGTLAELSKAHPNRAVGKMKATITHRFTFPESQFDVDCDCRFIFFAQRDPESGEWKARYVKLFYEKDKVVPVDGRTAPVFEKEELERYPAGYCYLGAAQARLGYEIDVCLPTPFNGGLYERMYGEMEKWLGGEEVDLFWEGE